MLRKDVLSPEEIQKLIACHYDNENPTIRRAFIFCLYCGLRFCDVKDLTYKNVDYANRLLKFEQSKTKGHSASSGVVIPLNDGLLSIIGEAPADKNCLIFDLPTYESCCKSVKRWVKRAGIDKHISWHCARHITLSYSLKTRDLQRLSAWQVTIWKPAGFSILQCSASIKRTLFSFAKVVFFSFIAKVIPLKNRVNQTSYHYCTFIAHLADENR